MVNQKLYYQMIEELKLTLGFDFESPSYKKLNKLLSDNVRAIYKKYLDKIGLDSNLPTVLVFGGSQGAQSINEAIIGIAKEKLKEVIKYLLNRSFFI